RLPPGRSPPALMVALHMWALAHGIAALFGRGDAARRSVPMPPEDLLEAGLLIYLDGLGLNRG
ncbi:MAG: TetR/AcrR family transcriptional regulator, partial [Geminicoccaceae bacterium]